MSTDPAPHTAGTPRQRIVHASGHARRARLTAAPGTTAEPVAADEKTPPRATGPNDERMRRDKPPHY